jgi:probable rRNA maturation factor
VTPVDRGGRLALKASVVVQRGRARGAPAAADIRRWALAALRERAREPLEVTVRVVDEAESAELNGRYRHREGPTNVLSFPFEDPPGVASGILGDVVICAPVVEREAREGSIPPAARWAHMVVHGVLHLCGYDHLREDEASAMETLEAQVLMNLGFGDPYD